MSVPPEWHDLYTEALKLLVGALIVIGRKVCRDVNQAFRQLRILKKRGEDQDKKIAEQDARIAALEKAAKLDTVSPCSSTTREGERNAS